MKKDADLMHKIGYALGAILCACGTAIVVAFTLKIIIWVFSGIWG